MELETRHQGQDEEVPGCDLEYGVQDLVNTPHHQPVILPVRLFQGSLLADLWSLISSVLHSTRCSPKGGFCQNLQTVA